MQKELKKQKVIVYTTPTCTYCVLVKNFLKEEKVVFEEIDVTKDPKQMEILIQKTGQLGVPVIDINGKIVIGFDRDALKRALKA